VFVVVIAVAVADGGGVLARGATVRGGGGFVNKTAFPYDRATSRPESATDTGP
jgi:hypothetical protein